MAAILIPVMREGLIELYLAHLCEFFAIVGVIATPLQPKPQIIQIRPNWFDQEEDVVALRR